VRRQGFFTLGDQLVSSASNVLIVMAIARTSSPADFGFIALMLTAVSAGLAIIRQGLGTPLMLTSAHGAERVRYEAQRSLTASMLFGLGLGCVVLAFGVAIGRADLAAPIALAAPVVLAQDVYRFIAISTARSSLAFISDGCWAILSLAAVIATWAGLPGLTGPLVVWIWAASALVCCLGMAYATRLLPRVTSLSHWWQENLPHRLRFSSEAAIASITVLSVSTLATVIVGPVATAALRGASVVMGPLNILMNALPLLIVPKAVQQGDTYAGVWRRLWPFGLLMSAIAVTVSLTGFLLPERIGALILGESWVLVAPLLPFIGLEYCALAWLSCNRTALQAKGRSGELLQLRVIFALTDLVLTAAAALLFGTAVSMAAALALSAIVLLLPAWRFGRLELQPQRVTTVPGSWG
jgi:O-antigen/teichoic acid export membrane protein